MSATKETLGFQTEVKQLLHLMIHSLYSNKEIFLRELISNASDAADKLRFAALTEPSLYENDSDLKVTITYDKDARTLRITDNGIGMSREEVIDNLGTIAKSGTKEFLAALSGDQAKYANLIGQFGVGFYSAFIVADKVTVNTRKAGLAADQGICWESAGEGDYSIENITKDNHGTEITLHLRKDEDEFLDDYRLRHIIRKYSDHILLPVEMQKAAGFDDATTEGDEQADKPTPMIEFETVNKATALWTLPKAELKDSDYNEFYKHVSHDFQDALLWAHNKVEGKQEYTSLLFIPARAPFDLWNRERQQGLKLYVRRVFIMADADQFMPQYLRFVKGVLDSNDLPLNISREILQGSKQVESIRAALTKRVLGMLEKLAKNDAEKYQTFWTEFGQVLKEGPAEDMANKDQIAKLLRFASTKADDTTQNVSLEDYISRMKPEQDKIYYIAAETFMAAKNSPHLEIFRKKGIEVLLLSERVDEWLISNLQEFNEKQLQSVAKGSLDLGKLDDEQDKEEHKKVEDEFETILKQVKQVLGDKIKEVRITHRLTESPACLVVDDHEMNMQMQRMLKAAGQNFMGSKPIFELNPTHPLIAKLKQETDDARFAEWTHILFDQAMLAEGTHLEDPAQFVKRLNTLLLDLSK